MKTNNKYPKWLERALELYRDGIAHAFLLHFNVADYIAPGVRLRSYLAKVLASRDIVVFYNIAEGLTFPRESDEERFRDFVTSMSAGAGASASSAVNKALAVARSGGVSDLPKAPAQVFPILEALLKKPPVVSEERPYKGAVIVIDYAEMIAPVAELSTLSPADREILISFEKWGRDPEIVNAGNMIFLVTSDLDQVHGNVRRSSARWEAIEIPLPDLAGRKKFIKWYLKNQAEDLEWGDIDQKGLANTTAGLSLLNVEDILLRSMRAGKVQADYVRDRKATLVSQEYSEVLEVWEPDETFEDIGGLDQVKDFFRRSVISPMKTGKTARIPQGVLMLGPAGTGKTIMARAIANEAGVNAVLFRVGRILGKYVGESEGKLERALRAIMAMAPVIVFIDEIDQQVDRGGGGDSGVSSRIFARLLEIMSDGDLRGKVIWLAASNRPDLLDAALKRPGRFDQKIAFLIPDQTEREAIFAVMVKKYMWKEGDIFEDALFAIGEAAKKVEGWTGAEIEAAVIKASQLLEDEKLDAETALSEAVRRLKPSTADIQYMTDLALAEINDIDLLPEKYRRELENRPALEKRIADESERRSVRAPREI